MSVTASWKELVVDALRHLDGEATLKDITAFLETHPLRPKTATWQATIRRVVRQYKVFEPFKDRAGRASYRLVEQPAADMPTAATGSDPHGEQQGMLLQIGTICGYETFTNATDRTIRRFGGRRISDLATVRNDAELVGLPLTRIRRMDVMWLAEDAEGLYPRYAFEVEESTKVRSGLLRLLNIPVRFNTTLMVIGKGDEEAQLFSRYVAASPFREHARRLHFHSYDEVRALYEAGVGFDRERTGFGVEMNRVA